LAVRVFIALELPHELSEGILGLARHLRESGIRASWCRRGTIHLTLKFLGDTEESELEGIIAAVAAAARGIAPFSFSLDRLGAFPSPRNARVIWVGVEPVQQLFDLQREVEEGLSTIGIPGDKRRFRPHITIGRVRGRAPESTAETLASLSAPEGTADVAEVRVMKSTLHPKGAIHEVIDAIPLGGS
jgi:2'-5' RNA ligase